MINRLILLGVFAQLCFAESPIIIGVRGGVPLGDVIHTVQSGSSISSSTDNYVVGPTLGVRLPLGFSVAADALFSRVNISTAATGTQGAISASASSWEFPVLLRFTAGSQGIAPFIGAGVSVRHLSDFGNIGPFLTNSPSTTGNVVGTSATAGFVIGGGLQFKIRSLHISPEIRYTHWGSDQIADAFRSVIHTNDNEGKILVGLTF
jgi:hypothetical protein